MAKLMRAWVVLLIAFLVTWSVAQAAGMATMQHDMAGLASHHEHATDSAHCDDCEMSGMSGGIGALCEIACVSPILAALPAGAAPVTAMPVTALHVSMPAVDLHGRSDPPDPFPPRAPFLT